MATLSITDRADGSGVNVSISSIAGTATLYAALYRGNVADNPFSIQITTAIDVVDQVVALPIGSYSAVVIDGSGPAAPVGFRVTDGDEGIHHRCLTALKDFVLAMNLSSFPTDADRYVVVKRPSNTYEELRDSVGSDVDGVFFWKREETIPRISLNTERDLEYVVEMVLVRAGGGGNKPDGDWTLDRERLLRALSVQCPLSAVSDVSIVNVRPGVLFDSSEQLGMDSQSLQFLCRSWVPAGFI